MQPEEPPVEVPAERLHTVVGEARTLPELRHLVGGHDVEHPRLPFGKLLEQAIEVAWASQLLTGRDQSHPPHHHDAKPKTASVSHKVSRASVVTMFAAA